MTIKLYYFDIPFWRAETARLALHLGQIPFEDVRIDGPTFRAMKKAGNLPFDQVPVLDFDGHRIAQTGAIARLCGKLSGHYPEFDRLAAARVDQIIDTATDITHVVGRTMGLKDADQRQAARAQLAQNTLPKWLSFLETILEKNRSSPFFVGSDMTIADLAVWRLVGWLTGGILDGIPTDLGVPFKSLTAHQKMMGDMPEIRSWMSERYG